MKDLGFGLIDRRTVVIFLVGIVLSNVVLGNSIPVDTSSADRLFVDLILITGYIYASRTLLRLPLAIIISLLIAPNTANNFIPEKFFKFAQKILYLEENERKPLPLIKKTLWQAKRFLIISFWLIAMTTITIFQLPFMIFSFDNWTNNVDSMIRIYYPSWLRFYVLQNDILRAITFWVFGLLDRIGIFLISVLVTLPSMANYIRPLGIAGLGLISILFILRGNFSGIVPDALKEGQDPSANKRG